MGRRSTWPAILGVAIVLLLTVAVVALAPVFTCRLCSRYASEAVCSVCGGDGRASLRANWSFRSWETGRRFVSPW